MEPNEGLPLIEGHDNAEAVSNSLKWTQFSQLSMQLLTTRKVLPKER